MLVYSKIRGTVYDMDVSKTIAQRRTNTREPKLARGLKGLTLEEGVARVVIKQYTRATQDEEKKINVKFEIMYQRHNGGFGN